MYNNSVDTYREAHMNQMRTLITIRKATMLTIKMIIKFIFSRGAGVEFGNKSIRKKKFKFQTLRNHSITFFIHLCLLFINR